MEDEIDGISVLRPVLAEKPWGGRRLADLGMVLPDGANVGEALVSADASTVAAGTGRGHTLGELMTDDRTASSSGNNPAGWPAFPLLVKLIDARENLSIQVHPDDRRAAIHRQPGKTEAWYVVDAKPGSYLYAGLGPGVTRDQFIEAASRLDGSSSSLLRRIPAQPGTSILLPAGTVHALGAGVLVYEIQQPSDITYRLDDWGRLDANGLPREMHATAGADAMDAGLRPELIPPVALPANEGRRHALVACEKFSLERMALVGGARWTLPHQQGPQVMTLISGSVRIGTHELHTGESVVIWPSHGPRELFANEPAVLLRGWVPDLAVEVGQYATMAGVDLHDLQRLSGPLPDMRLALEAREKDSR